MRRVFRDPELTSPAVSRGTFLYFCPATSVCRRRRRVVGARAVGTRAHPGALPALPSQTLASGGPTRGLRPAGLLTLPAASFSSDSNRRLFRYVKLSTKDCNFSSFVLGRYHCWARSWATDPWAEGRLVGGGWRASGLPPGPSSWYSLRFLHNAVMLIR